MKIHGLQKLTLLDFPGITACTVFLAGCDFACPFCHNAQIIDGSVEPIMEEDELFKFLEKRKGLLDGVAFTGGEPTLRKDLPEVMSKIKDLGYKVKLDTNGNHTAMLKTLVDDGLVDYIAMDIKNDKAHYAATAGLEALDLSNIEKSIDLIMGCGIDYEFRTTVVDQLHDEDSFKGIGPWIDGASQYFLQAFTDRDSVIFGGFSAPSREKLEKYASLVSTHVKHVEIRGVD